MQEPSGKMRHFFFAAAAIPTLASCGPYDDDEHNVAGESAREISAAMGAGGIESLDTGAWESTLKVSDIDLPSLAASRRNKIVSRVEKDGAQASCLDAEKAKSPPPSFFAGNAEDCRYGRFELVGGTANISLSCEMASVGAVDMELTGPMTEKSFAFDAKIGLRLPMIGHVPVEAKLVGRHKGPCEAKR